MSRLRGAVVMGAVLLFAACDSGTEPTAEPSPEPSVITSSTPTPVEPACPNQDRAVQATVTKRGPLPSVDIDGDGEPDRVDVVVHEDAEQGCRAFLVVVTASGAIAAPVWEIGREGGLPQPRIVDLVNVNGEEGAEIIVSEAAGASTEFAGLFMVQDGVLTRVTFDAPSEDAFSEDLFAYGGSVGHIEGVGCEGPGTIVVSVATPGQSQGDLEEGIYEVERRLFVFDGSTLIDAGIQQEQIPIEELERFPEFASGPFGTCEEAG
jgi:hypothetical protein